MKEKVRKGMTSTAMTGQTVPQTVPVRAQPMAPRIVPKTAMKA